MMQYSRHARRSRAACAGETLEHELYRIRQQEQALHFAALQQPLQYAMALLSQPVCDVIADHCDEVEAVLQEIQQTVQGCIATFEAPDLGLGVRPYMLLLKLCSFHRTLVEAQVLVGNVRGLCRRGRLMTDLTGSYWHLRQYVRAVIRDCGELLDLLDIQVVPSTHLSSVQTDMGTANSTSSFPCVRYTAASA